MFLSLSSPYPPPLGLHRLTPAEDLVHNSSNNCSQIGNCAPKIKHLNPYVGSNINGLISRGSEDPWLQLKTIAAVGAQRL